MFVHLPWLAQYPGGWFPHVQSRFWRAAPVLGPVGGASDPANPGPTAWMWHWTNLKIDMDGCMKNGAWWGLSCQLFTIRLLKINILDNVTMIHGSMDLSWKTYLVNVFKITTTLYLTEALMCSTIGIWSMPLVYWIKRLQCQQSVHILVGLVFGSQFGFSVLLFILVPFDVEKPIAMRWA